MRENTLLKIALICSLLGLSALYFISAKIEINDYKPSVLSKNVGDDVKLEGQVMKITDNGDVIFVELSQQNPVTIVMFTNNNVQLRKGDDIEVIGKVQEYKGKSEIIAQKIRVVK